MKDFSRRFGIMPFRKKNNNNDNDKDNDSDNYNNNDYDNDNDKNKNENSNCGELCSQQTCLAQIGLEISPDVSRTFCFAFMPFIRTADHYQAGSNTSLRSLCEFFGLLFPFWSVISQAFCACSQVRENLEVLMPSCSAYFVTFLVLAKTFLCRMTTLDPAELNVTLTLFEPFKVSARM